MEFSVLQLIKALIFPPGLFVVLIIAAIYLLKVNLKYAKRLMQITAITLYLLSLPIVTEILITPLEPYPPLTKRDLHNTDAAAIVILSAGRFKHQPEYDNRDISNDVAFGRLRYGAKVYRETHLPILISGGLGEDNSIPLSELMAEDLRTSFNIETRWQENKSKNTAENARYSWDILHAENISHILLVTDAWHMRRAVPVFEKQGFDVTPAPTRFKGLNKHSFDLEFNSFLPSVKALSTSYYALHELLGVVWYSIRY